MMLKQFVYLTILATLLGGAIPVNGQPTGVYMGKASTGEAVYYQGARAQCGDLPRTHECWRNPMIAYTIGRDHVAAIPNCQRGMFKEVWIGDRLVARNMKPASRAIQRVLETGCNSALPR